MIWTAAGRPEWMFGMLEDISKRKRQENALRKSEAFLGQTDRLAGVGGWDLDLLTGEIAWSAGTCSIHGVDRNYRPALQEALDFYAPEARPLIEAAIADATAAGTGWDLELPLIKADGCRLWVRTVGSVVVADGKPVRLTGAIQDVTEQVAQRQALEAANERVTLATDTAGIGIWEWNVATGTAVWDDGMHSLYGRTRTDGVWTYQEWLQLLHPEDREAAAEGARRAVKDHVPLNQNSRIVWQDGSIHYIHGIGRTYCNEQGVVTRMVGVNWDVTDAHLLEKERDERERELRIVNAELERTSRHLVRARDTADRANRAKSRFLAGMSHELRTPLNGILGYAQLLRLEGGLNDVQGRRLDAMLDAGTHLLDMISSVLELSEIETEHVELRPIEVDLPKIAMASLDLVRPKAQAKGLRLTCCADFDAPRTIVTDQTRLRQIILNLLGNAVKFTDHGQVELRLLALPGTASFRIHIADTGPGIGHDQRNRLFQDFERLQANVIGMVEGAGLGLALSSRLATLLGGQMGYDDNPGGGSIFWVELPLNTSAMPPVPAAAPEQDVAVAECAPTKGEPVSRPLRVLVVDDVAINRDIACAFLLAVGHETICADGGEASVQAALAGDIDVVLMDVRMPEVDGLEATRRIRLLFGQASRVPIIGLTAQAFAEQVLACTQAGMDGHLSKPYTPDALRDTVARAAALPAGRRSKVFVAPTDTKPVAGELPVLDPNAVSRMAEYLSPPIIDSYRRTIAARCETMLKVLREPGAIEWCNEVVAEAAHTLAGCAGMLGFARLAQSGVAFERALRSRSPDAALLADRLATSIKATLREVHHLPRPHAT